MWVLQTSEDSRDLGIFTFRLASGAIKTIGRATGADFVIDTALVSRLHCRVSVSSAGHLLVEDLESTNGTFVNDRRVRRSALVAGDRLRLGRIELDVKDE